MNNLKVFHGTRSADSPRLCDSCNNGVVLRGPADSEEYVYCSLVEKQIPIRVTECNRYSDRTHAPLWALKEIAWVLHTDTKRQKMGFVTAKEWQSQNEGENMVPGQIA